MSDNILLDKSKAFALRIIKMYKYLTEEKKEYVLSKQVLRSGTSIGANAREASRGQSKADFYAKLYISLKEADETQYWNCFMKVVIFLKKNTKLFMRNAKSWLDF